MFDIPAELKKLPESPGVYIMRDKTDDIIYVGKAKILKNRVRQYFQNSANHSLKVKQMVSNIDHFEYIVTGSEVEALILENNLIKKHNPKYNILLKDDKTYPYIKVTTNEMFPRVFVTRKLLKDKNKYFGPFRRKRRAWRGCPDPLRGQRTRPCRSPALRYRSHPGKAGGSGGR